MSVYTPVSADELAAWLERYPLGGLRSLTGIREGVQNSNFFVETEGGSHVLTLFEQVDPALLPFYLDLMARLSARGIPCPAPRAMRDGRLLGELKGRPATLFSRLSGVALSDVGAAHCAAAGEALARLHLAAADMPAPAHPRGAGWIAATAARVLPRLAGDDATLLANELAFQAQATPTLPAGVIHADFFRDNVLFDATATPPRIAGILDFYFAGHGEWLFDLAIAANDWCSDASGKLDAARADALIAAYAAQRPLTADEQAAWPRALRAAALRFWLSRLDEFHAPAAGSEISVRDPAAYGRILRARIALASPATRD